MFRDSLASVTGAGAADGTPTGKKAPSQRSAAGDLWAGFDTPARGALGSALDHAEEPGNVPMLSVVLMLLGLGAALGGIGIAGARRRSRLAARAADQRSLD